MRIGVWNQRGVRDIWKLCDLAKFSASLCASAWCCYSFSFPDREGPQDTVYRPASVVQGTERGSTGYRRHPLSFQSGA